MKLAAVLLALLPFYAKSESLVCGTLEDSIKTVAVSYGEMVSVRGELSCSGITQNVANAVAYSVRFKKADDSLCMSGMLWGTPVRGEYMYLDGNVKPYWFHKEIVVPKGAVSLEIAPYHFRGDGVYRIAGHEVVTKKIVEPVAAFSFSWFCMLGREFCAGGMSFISLRFLAFVALALSCYFLVPLCARPYVLLGVSIFFYTLFSPWAWLFLGFSIVSVYVAALLMDKFACRKLIVSVLIIANIGLLVWVKYAGLVVSDQPIIVPMGISFYTLQAVAYLVDVYRGDLPAEHNFLKLVLFLSFFPAIIQGPISRYSQLSCQLWTPHRFSGEALRDGLQLALWGFFKKMVIADRAGIMVDQVFKGGGGEGIVVVIAVCLYSIQIYADFSGCVDISRGISQCFGIDLMRNFNHPYLAESVAEFWRRWHISLSLWLRDYVYIPLGGNRRGKIRKYFNVLVVFAVSGLWHGTGINFFIWGLLHGFYQVFAALTKGIRVLLCDKVGISTTSFSMRMTRRIITFTAVGFAWLFFRAKDFDQARELLRASCKINPWCLFDGTLVKFGLDVADWMVLVASILVLIAVSLLQERMQVRRVINRQVIWMRWTFALLGLAVVLVLGVYGPGYNARQFIYMQF